MNGFAKGLSGWLAVLLTVLGTGCATVKENGLTANLWQKDPCTTIQEQQAHGDKYIHSTFTRATLTPLAVVGDVTIVGVAVGAGCVVAGCAAACQDAAQNGGRITR